LYTFKLHNEDRMSASQWFKHPTSKLIILAILFLGALALHLLYSRIYSTSQIIHELLNRGSDTSYNDFIWNDWVPRACGCAVVGAILGVVGAAFQAIFRNPLAEPYIVGVSSGAAVGGAIALITGFGATWSGMALQLGTMSLAFPCGLVSLGMVLLFARQKGVLDIQTLLLAGVVTGSMLSSVLSLLLLYGGLDTGVILRWLLGNMSDLFWTQVNVMTVALVIGAAILILYSKQLNAFAMGESTAEHLGVNVRRLKAVVLITGTAMVASTVGPVGIIGFIGLVAPHLSRRIIGVDWRYSLVGAGILGATLLLLADHLSQHLIKGTPEVEVGILTSILGAPFLLIIMRVKRSG
jgi:iron complex transport system permease protein